MTWLLRHRVLISKATALLFLAATFLLSMYLYRLEHANGSPFLLLLAPLVSLLGSFGPDILSAITRRFGPTPAELYASAAVDSFCAFFRDYFTLELSKPQTPRHASLASQLESSLDGVGQRFFARNANDDKRRRQLTIPLFLVHSYESLSVPDHPEVHAYLRSCIRGLTDLAEREFIALFNEIIIHQRKHIQPSDYFIPLEQETYARARFTFYDRYLKDDYIQQIATKLKLTEGRLRSFKASLRSIGTSDRFNLGFLKDFVHKRSTYRKLFLLVSEKNLPRPIQTYITQNPHFILDYSSIANLPVIGLSDRFDIFFFSPSDLVPSSSALLDRLGKLDPGFAAHPVRVYEIDPTEGLGTNLPPSSHFTQSLAYFENGAIDTTGFADLTFDQVVTLLQRGNIPLRELFQGFPPGELATSGRRSEKTLLSELAGPLMKSDAGEDLFRLVPNASRLKKKIATLKKVSVEYSSTDITELYSGNATLSRFRKRLSQLATELIANLSSLDEMLR